MKERETERPELKMTKIQQAVWEEITLPTWVARCEVQHGEDSRAGGAEDVRLSEMIVWYTQNKDRVLSHYDRGLVDRDWSTVHRLSRARRAWIVKCLDTAKDAHENEQRQAAKSQNVITKFFPKKAERKGRGNPDKTKSGEATGEAKRCGGGDRAPEAMSRVIEEERPAGVRHGDKVEGPEETNDQETAREVSESESGESEWSGASKVKWPKNQRKVRWPKRPGLVVNYAERGSSSSESEKAETEQRTERECTTSDDQWTR